MENLDYHLDGITKQIRKIRHEIIEDLNKKGVKNVSRIVVEECFEWARGVQKEHPNTYRSVRSYWGMVGGHSPDTATVDDFKGKDSAFVFLENLRTRLLGRKTK